MLEPPRKGREVEVKTLTVRNLPPGVVEAVRAKAKRERLSVSQAIVRLLEEATGQAKRPEKKTVHHDLDRFFGGWTKEQADAFDRALREQRRIEPTDQKSANIGEPDKASVYRGRD